MTNTFTRIVKTHFLLLNLSYRRTVPVSDVNEKMESTLDDDEAANIFLSVRNVF